MTTDAVSGLTATISIEGDVIAGFRAATLSASQATQDATSADSGRWDELIAGRRSFAIDVDALYIYNDIAQKALDEHVFEGNPTTVLLVLTMPDLRTYTGEAIVTSLVYNVPFEDVISVAATLQNTDGLVTTTS